MKPTRTRSGFPIQINAAPYLEKGNMTRPEVWQQLLQVFRGNFVVFAIWFNCANACKPSTKNGGEKIFTAADVYKLYGLRQ